MPIHWDGSRCYCRLPFFSRGATVTRTAVIEELKRRGIQGRWRGCYYLDDATEPAWYLRGPAPAPTLDSSFAEDHAYPYDPDRMAVYSTHRQRARGLLQRLPVQVQTEGEWELVLLVPNDCFDTAASLLQFRRSAGQSTSLRKIPPEGDPAAGNPAYSGSKLPLSVETQR